MIRTTIRIHHQVTLNPIIQTRTSNSFIASFFSILIIMINILSIFLSVISAMIIGTIWYSPKTITGKNWLKYTEFEYDENNKPSNRSLFFSFGGTIIGSFLMATILSFFVHLYHRVYVDTSFLISSLIVGFLVWVGFIIVRSFQEDTFNGRPIQLTLNSFGNSFVTIFVMSLIIGLLK